MAYTSAKAGEAVVGRPLNHHRLGADDLKLLCKNAKLYSKHLSQESVEIIFARVRGMGASAPSPRPPWRLRLIVASRGGRGGSCARALVDCELPL